MGKKIWRKTYGFRLTKECYELEDYLDSMTSGQRADFIRAALLWYYKYGSLLEKILAGVEQLQDKVDKLVIITGSKYEDKEKKKNNLDPYFIDGMLDIIKTKS